jgi:hypothetical protein
MPVTLTLPSEKGTLLDHTEMEKNLTDLRDAVNVARLETVQVNSASFNAGGKQVILANASAASQTINLPVSAVSLDVVYVIKKVDATVNTVTVQADGVETIDGSNTHVLTTQNERIYIICDGTQWHIIN